MKHFHYTDNVGVIRITARRRPSQSTVPKRGSWVVRELSTKGEWEMPAFPEINWVVLNAMTYLGNVPIDTVSKDG